MLMDQHYHQPKLTLKHSRRHTGSAASPGESTRDPPNAHFCRFSRRSGRKSTRETRMTASQQRPLPDKIAARGPL